MIARRLVIAAACLFSLPALGFVLPTGDPAQQQTPKQFPAKVAWADPPVRVQPASSALKPVVAPTPAPEPKLALAAPKVELVEIAPAAAPIARPEPNIVRAAPQREPKVAPTEEGPPQRMDRQEPEKPKAQARTRQQPVAQARPATDRAAKFTGGEGASWKNARNAYAFAGNYGGCRFSGRLGPGGFSLDRICR